MVEGAAGADPEHRRMGTTLTLAYVQWPRLYVVHAGDSRCYLLRGARLHRITRDHTIAQQMVDRGTLTADQAAESRWNHVIWNCVGGGKHELNPDVHKAALEPGDVLLLCTDGLTKAVPDGRVAEVLAGAGGRPRRPGGWWMRRTRRAGRTTSPSSSPGSARPGRRRSRPADRDDRRPAPPRPGVGAARRRCGPRSRPRRR